MKRVPRKPLLFLLSITAIFLLLQFVAPLTLEPGTVEDLDANANRMDYDWSSLPPLQRAVYAAGDFKKIG